MLLLKKLSFLNQNLHILFLSSWYPSRILPNNGNFVQRHAEAVATKHKVTSIHVITDVNLKNKIEVVEADINKVKTLIAYIKPSKNPITKLVRFFRAYLNLINRAEYFNLVHLNVIYPVGIIALYLKWFKQKSFIISEHWSDYQFPLNIKISIFVKIITKKIVKNASFVCPVSKHLQDAMTDFGLIGNYHPVPNVVDTKKFNFHIKGSINFTITHISDMDDEYKNITGILNTLSKIQKSYPNIHINLIGHFSDKYLPLLKKLTIKNIKIIGQIQHHQVADYLNNSDVLVLFSNYENLPCVILEAFSCGVPVVATNVGGISEYFPKDFGELITPKDEYALEKALIKIYQSHSKPNQTLMHQYAEDYFSMNAISAIFSRLYYQTLNVKN